ncbi:ComEA family DNA-binding protein [Carnimonas bestiolae]|uniref:ComEA family DNA-binding protein n=1 Tax=Carnimonas bestiolae TaxID=3402172 RepID=UPI003EDC2304
MKNWLAASLYSLLVASTLAFAAPQAIDINSANVSELVALPGIGKAKAEAIIAERDANGPFVDSEDLARVGGIGSATAKKLEKHLEFNASPKTSVKSSPAATPKS